MKSDWRGWLTFGIALIALGVALDTRLRPRQHQDLTLSDGPYSARIQATGMKFIGPTGYMDISSSGQSFATRT